jgi:hypothetical protein
MRSTYSAKPMLGLFKVVKAAVNVGSGRLTDGDTNTVGTVRGGAT